MPKRDTKLQKLSETIHITVEELRGLGVEGLDRLFMEEYLSQAGQLTDSRQQVKVRHSLKDIIGIVFFAVLAGNDEWTEIADFAVDERQTLENTWSWRTGSLPMIPYRGSFSSSALRKCRTCW